MTGAPTSTGPGEPGDDATDEAARPRPNVVQISTYTPPPGGDSGIRSQAAYGGPVVFARRVRPWRMLVLVVVVAGVLGVGGVWVYRTVRDAQHRTTGNADVVSTSVTPSTTVAGAPITVAPPPTLPTTGTLFDPAVAALLSPAIAAAAPGEPDQFTSIAVYPAYAVLTVRDPANAARTIRLTARGGDIIADEPVTQSLDVTPSLFTLADVDWTKMAPLIEASPAAAGVPDDTVDHVVVQRWGFDPAFPMRILVYLGGGRFIEAATDGTVIAAH